MMRHKIDFSIDSAGSGSTHWFKHPAIEVDRKMDTCNYIRDQPFVRQKYVAE